MNPTDEQLAAELRALRQTPSMQFAASLDRQAAEGFPRDVDARRTRELPWGRIGLALAPLTAVALVAIVIAGQSGGGSDHSAPVQPSAVDQSGSSKSAAEDAAGSSGSAAGAHGGNIESPPFTDSEPVPPSSDRPRNSRNQVQERTASLGLSTDSDELEDVSDGVVDVTERYDGFVDSSNVHAGGDRGRATFALRIPTAHLQDALADLSDLAHVTRRDQGSTNVTGSYVSASETYADAQAAVASLQRRLQGATTASEIASLRALLATSRHDLAGARSTLRDLKQRVALTPVNVTITAAGDGAWSIGDAADDAGDVLQAIGGALLITLAVLIPAALLLALGWFATNGLRQRRREATLDR